MFKRRPKVDNLSVEELEKLLKIKQREARQERFLRLSANGASKNRALLGHADPPPVAATTPVPQKAVNAGLLQTPQVYPLKQQPPIAAATKMPAKKPGAWRNRVLGVIEIVALLGLIAVLAAYYFNLRELNQEALTIQTQTVTSAALPQIASSTEQAASVAFGRLPGGHTSPTSAGGVVPDVPAHLQNWVQPTPAIPVPVPAQPIAVATRIVIPKINVDAPIVQGITWEDLKKGVGHLPGSAQPGQRGNLYLAAHNDIFGEIFRYLEKLEPGDKYYIYAGKTKYTYVVREKQIVAPTEVSVMLPTTEPVATLQTCYPYLIDTQRLVIIGDLVN